MNGGIIGVNQTVFAGLQTVLEIGTGVTVLGVSFQFLFWHTRVTLGAGSAVAWGNFSEAVITPYPGLGLEIIIENSNFTRLSLQIEGAIASLTVYNNAGLVYLPKPAGISMITSQLWLSSANLPVACGDEWAAVTSGSKYLDLAAMGACM